MSENDAKQMVTTRTELDQGAAVVKAAGIDLAEFDMAGAEVIQSGGITKWVDLSKFQDDPTAPQNKAVKGNGRAFAGALLSRQEIEVADEDSGEVKADGTKVRYFYLLRLVAPCPVTYKDEEKETIEEDAQPGEVVAIGERHHLKGLRDLCDDGGLHIVVIKPHSRVKIGGGHTMWTFDVVKKTIRQPMRIKAEVVTPKAPF